MRRMDYPIAKAKELNLEDNKWFERPDQNNVYLKKRLPNGVYELKLPKDISQGDKLAVNLIKKLKQGGYQSLGYRALFVIATPTYSIKDIVVDPDESTFSNGLRDADPYFVVNGGTAGDIIPCLIVKDDIVFLTAIDEW